MTAFERLATWSAWLEATGHAPDTVRSYRYWMLRYLADTLADPWEATEDDVVAWIAGLPRRGLSRREALKALHSYWRWAAPRAGRNPVERLRTPRPRPQPVQTLTPEEVRAILRAAFRHSPRRGWSLMLLASTGLRIGSLVAVRPEDVDLARGVLHVRRAKAGRTYSVPLSRPALVACSWLVADADGRETLVGVREEAVRTWLRRAAAEAGITRRVWPHLLRHTVATRVAEVADVETLREVMGWSDLSMAAVYVHPSVERRRAALEVVLR